MQLLLVPPFFRSACIQPTTDSSCVRAEGSSSSNAHIGATTVTTPLPAAVAPAIGNELRLRFAPDFQMRRSRWLGSMLYDDSNMIAN